MPLSEDQHNLLVTLKRNGQQLAGRGGALTSLIGELTACEALGVDWVPSVGL